MGLLTRFYKAYIVFCTGIFFFAAAAGVYAADAVKETGEMGVKECEGVELTQCELAKNLILTLKMGEDLTCEACFISLRAIDIAPGADWNYADPHKVIMVPEITAILAKIHSAYTKGMVRHDALDVAAGLNSFCRGIKGPSTPPPASDVTEKKKEDMKQDEIKSSPAGTPVMGTEQQKGEK
jgi:hypothetical protein